MSEIERRAKASQSESFRRLNPHLFTVGAPTQTANAMLTAVQGKPLWQVFAEEDKRIRQGEKKPSKTEQEWQRMVEATHQYVHIKAQSLRVRLANGAWYKPDVTGIREDTGIVHCWEVKGGSKMKGVSKGMLALKTAATTYPEFAWILVWKEKGQWKQQEIDA